MKPKTIKKVLDSKFNSFLKSITNKSVRKLVEENTIITGGCIASMLLREDVNDYDLYFRDMETVKAVAEYYVQIHKQKKRLDRKTPKEMHVTEKDGRVRIMIRSSGVESETTNNEEYMYFENLEPGDPRTEGFVDNALEYVKDTKKTKQGVYRPVFLTSNAISLSDDVQLILRFYGDPLEIHKNYDYVHCTNYWTSWDKELVLNTDALASLLSRELIYTGSLYPICSIIRMRKFLKRGWSITAGQIFKMAWQVSKLNLEDFEVLEDQLIGVDVAYFHQLIEGLKKADKEGVDIDYMYIVKLIDEIF
jgi:hypothetical protein